MDYVTSRLIDEPKSGYYPPTPMYYGAVAEAKDMRTPISPGQTEINVRVTVIYVIQ